MASNATLNQKYKKSKIIFTALNSFFLLDLIESKRSIKINPSRKMAELAPHEEKKQIKDLVNNTKLKEGQEWFVVDFKWWQLWKAYVGYEDTTGSNGGDGPRPGPITNTDLLDAAEVAGTESNRLRPGLVEEYDYVVIPKEAWIKLESWYAHLHHAHE